MVPGEGRSQRLAQCLHGFLRLSGQKVCVPRLSQSLNPPNTKGWLPSVKTEPVQASEEAHTPTKRCRRTNAESQAEKAANEKLSLISVIVDDTQFDGQAE